MVRQLSRRILLAGGGSGLLLAGCDLIDFAKNPVIHFKLPAQKYTLTTADPAWRTPPAFFAAPISCVTKENCCPPPGTPAGVVVPECAQTTFVCQASACGIAFPLEVARSVSLAKDAPSLAGMSASTLTEVTLETLEFKITNMVGVDFPPVSLYIAPASTTTADGAGAQLIGVTPVAPAGITMDAKDTSPEVRQAFMVLARDLNKPFNFIAKTSMAVVSGHLPTVPGHVDIEITGTVTAKL